LAATRFAHSDPTWLDEQAEFIVGAPEGDKLQRVSAIKVGVAQRHRDGRGLALARVARGKGDYVVGRVNEGDAEACD
jgi:CubicO group peptidase (beta-lactamase class C family)